MSNQQENQHAIQASTIKSTQAEKVLDDYLPNNYFSILQKISRELDFETYPTTGILDIFFELHTKQRSLFDEIDKYRRNK